ncbi:hypothetical protein [Kitasatospora aureofaciens]|uniref:hypothetical protein n=1 Tax=Kitasatospora aureofaciens TaxID=1894 RepID=UPI0036F4A2D0
MLYTSITHWFGAPERADALIDRFWMSHGRAPAEPGPDEPEDEPEGDVVTGAPPAAPAVAGAAVAGTEAAGAAESVLSGPQALNARPAPATRTTEANSGQRWRTDMTAPGDGRR